MALNSQQESTVPSNSAPPSSTGKATVGPSKGSTGRKRKTEVGPTPPRATKKAKRGTFVAASFAQADKDDLLGIVLVRDNFYQTLTRAKMARVKTELSHQVDAVIDAGKRLIPRFTNHESFTNHTIVDLLFPVLTESPLSNLKQFWTIWKWERVIDYCVSVWLLQTRFQGSPVQRFL